MSENVQTPIVEVPEQIYVYQPTDENNRPIGGKQVIKYRSEEELRDKLKEQNVLLIRKLRQETKKNRLGIVEDEVIGDDVQRLQEQVEFAPRDLSQEELYEISRDLIDPTKAADATTRLIEARLGAPLEALGTTLRTVQQDNVALRAKVEANAFVVANPDYYRCDENMDAIVGWMVRYNLAPTKVNFQTAFDTLKSQGVLISGPEEPVALVVVPSVEKPVEKPVVLEKPEDNVIQRVPSVSITRDNTSDAGTPIALGSDITYTIGGKVLTGLAAIQAMPSEEYKRRLLSDKEFGKKVDKLEAESRKRG